MAKSLYVKEFTLAVLLDIEGALNNINLNGLLNVLNSLNPGQGLVGFIHLLHKSKTVTSSVGTAYCKRNVCRSTLQGGIILPLL